MNIDKMKQESDHRFWLMFYFLMPHFGSEHFFRIRHRNGANVPPSFSCPVSQNMYELRCDQPTTLYAMALQPTKRGAFLENRLGTNAGSSM